VKDTVSIRDPVHGTMLVNRAERAVLDARAVQRLRGVRQLGFADLAFPGATHSRYAHSLGAMYLAGVMSDAILGALDLPSADAAWLRERVRLAALLHDIGHPPLSHASERLMPPLAALGLPAWCVEPGKVQATHEDYTIHLILGAELSHALDSGFGAGCANEIAALIAGRLPPEGSPFVRGAVDYFPLLRQLVSGELDVDRMDYLLRDSFYTGVDYGQYDHEWLCQHARAHIDGGKAFLALGNRAIFAFEDFLLSRYHMFLAVYHHYIPVGFDHLMSRYAEEARGEYVFPTDPDAYVQRDDAHLISALRASPNRWAQCLAYRRGYRLLLETTERDHAVPRERLLAALAREGIDHFEAASSGTLSKYMNDPTFPMYVVTESLRQVTPLREYTPLFARYATAVKVSRIYVEPSHAAQAKAVLERELGIPGSL
jgi:HD superfamily phosphohydrolase